MEEENRGMDALDAQEAKNFDSERLGRIADENVARDVESLSAVGGDGEVPDLRVDF